MTTRNSSLKEYIKSRAAELGFDRVGIARATEVEPSYWDEFLFWLDRYSADMDWLHNYKELRHDPRKIMEGAASLIVVGLNYYVREHETDDNKVAKYAWGRDYHKVLKNKLNKLADIILEESPDTKYRAFVDTGPILERYWAMKSGVGWIGKNSLILDDKIGSYMFLGVLLTDLELEPDEEGLDKCGPCRLCIEKCPTHAITENRQVDSSLCISYHTIENRGEIPDDIDLSGWIYGCDVCQDVCPYNSGKAVTRESDFLNYNAERVHYKGNELSESEYDELTRGSAMRRAKYGQFIRNLKHK